MEDPLLKKYRKTKHQLDTICQEASNMNVEEFMKVYESLMQDFIEKRRKKFQENTHKPKSTPDLGNIGKKFQENMIDDMFSDMDIDPYDNI